jgi:hypothetical protein
MGSARELVVCDLLRATVRAGGTLSSVSVVCCIPEELKRSGTHDWCDRWCNASSRVRRHSAARGAAGIETERRRQRCAIVAYQLRPASVEVPHRVPSARGCSALDRKGCCVRSRRVSARAEHEELIAGCAAGGSRHELLSAVRASHSHSPNVYRALNRIDSLARYTGECSRSAAICAFVLVEADDGYFDRIRSCSFLAMTAVIKTQPSPTAQSRAGPQLRGQ